MLSWIKELFYVVRNYRMDLRRLEQQTHALRRRVIDLENQLRLHTTLGVDIGYPSRGDNWCVLVGRLGNRDYVQTFRLDGSSFEEVANQLKWIARRADTHYVDAPPDFKAVMVQDLAEFKGRWWSDTATQETKANPGPKCPGCRYFVGHAEDCTVKHRADGYGARSDD